MFALLMFQSRNLKNINRLKKVFWNEREYTRQPIFWRSANSESQAQDRADFLWFITVTSKY
jgi:hypothetical protein